MSQKIWNTVVFIFSAGGYVPIAIGGWQHPGEVNIATYGLWTIIVSIMLYSYLVQKYDGWIMPFGWVIGNFSMVAMAIFFLKDWTFNLVPEETCALYGILTVVSVWAAVGQITKTWDPRILFFGTILVDIFSFYPEIKFYVLPHPIASDWKIAGWTMFFLGTVLNLIFVERFLEKFHRERSWRTVEHSALSLENAVLLLVTVVLMTL